MNELAKQEYARWLQNCTGETLDELRAMDGNDALIEQRFGHKQTFGTAGIRSVMAAGIANFWQYTQVTEMATQGKTAAQIIEYDYNNVVKDWSYWNTQI